MKNFTSVILLLLISTASYAGRYVITEAFGKKLLTPAYFYVGNRSVWTLDYRNGTMQNYTILLRRPDEPECNIEAMDDKKNRFTMCITKEFGQEAIISLKYKDVTYELVGRYYAD
jgi:hypothetical protein